MRLPRRTPWADIKELDEVCIWIYSEISDVASQKAALNRVSCISLHHLDVR